MIPWFHMLIVFKSIRIVPYSRHNEYLWKGVNRPCKDFFKTLLACAEIWGTTDYIEFTGGGSVGDMGRNRDPYHRYCQSDSCIDMFGQSDEYGDGMWWCFVTNSMKLRTWFVNLYLLVQFTHIDDKKQGFLRCFDVRAHTHWILNFI